LHIFLDTKTKANKSTPTPARKYRPRVPEITGSRPEGFFANNLNSVIAVPTTEAAVRNAGVSAARRKRLVGSALISNGPQLTISIDPREKGISSRNAKKTTYDLVLSFIMF